MSRKLSNPDSGSVPKNRLPFSSGPGGTQKHPKALTHQLPTRIQRRGSTPTKLHPTSPRSSEGHRPGNPRQQVGTEPALLCAVGAAWGVTEPLEGLGLSLGALLLVRCRVPQGGTGFGGCRAFQGGLERIWGIKPAGGSQRCSLANYGCPPRPWG